MRQKQQAARDAAERRRALLKAGLDVQGVQEARLDAERILRDQRATREVEELRESPLDKKMMENLVNGIPPKMTEAQRRSVDRVYNSFMENRYSRKGRSKADEDPDNFTQAKVAKRAAATRAAVDKLVHAMELKDKRFQRKMRGLTGPRPPKTGLPASPSHQQMSGQHPSGSLQLTSSVERLSVERASVERL